MGGTSPRCPQSLHLWSKRTLYRQQDAKSLAFPPQWNTPLAPYMKWDVINKIQHLRRQREKFSEKLKMRVLIIQLFQEEKQKKACGIRSQQLKTAGKYLFFQGRTILFFELRAVETRKENQQTEDNCSLLFVFEIFSNSIQQRERGSKIYGGLCTNYIVNSNLLSQIAIGSLSNDRQEMQSCFE